MAQDIPLMDAYLNRTSQLQRIIFQRKTFTVLKGRSRPTSTILPDKGNISVAEAKAKAETEYDIFNKTQQIDSDFDEEIRGMLDS